jgi:protein-disulfide isomerase
LAVAARCAGQYGKFWEFHDLAFARQKQGNPETVRTWLLGLGIAKPEVDACLESPSKYEKIKADVDLGLTVEVDGTPSLYINGKKYIGDKDFAALRAEVARLLAQ